MKAKALQFGKAISAALFVLLLSVAGMKNALAQTQVATLQHNDSIAGVYYGQNALVSAYNAAVAGDIITLSSGTFNKCNEISKAITINGAGCVYDTLTSVMPTIITGNFSLKSSNVSFEGLWFNGTIDCPFLATGYYAVNNVRFNKCNIAKLSNTSNSDRSNYQFVNCIIKEFPLQKHINATIINSVIRFTAYTHGNSTNPTTINNSVILFDNGLPINNIIAYNSVISTVSEHIVSNCSFFNCIGIETGETMLFEGQTAQNVMEADSYEDVFEAFIGEVSDDNIYWLKEEVATSFLGNDGTEVGIFGGMMPYNPRPSYMIMKHCNVAPRSTIDGKLSVDIEIIATDE